ncbi:glycoside hydrolase family 97 protein [Pedobacter rhodius]|uniref:Glycoside hydrolase family 97 N-terminal domain-containing protein n=1 Tax=Pedobacter rhodius TaxID=3004098 RepID=A0ABT4KX16_9SPHI|nr:glycoside hydrolase family 97 protein [Pedobacter sp. SJ11]MCZ4223479.1 glycoside hydrolase family 97 N-terminal domain-containing protein [Pedobacter sp. SJ11]
MLKNSLLFLLFSITSTNICFGQQVVDGTKKELLSPNRKLLVKFFQQTKNNKREFYYQLNYQDKTVIKPSLMDLQLDNHLSESAMALPVDKQNKWFDNLVVKHIIISSKDTTWKPIYGENAAVRDHYNALIIETVKDDNPIYKMNIEIRAYDEGIAFRYYFPENEKGTYYRVVSENTEFALPEGTMTWVAQWAQAPYHKIKLADWKAEAERPLTLELANGLFASLVEAKMVDYARTKFKLSKTKPNTVETSMFTPADLISPFATPWRAVMVAESATELAANNALILNLNDPGEIKNPDWIKPGKIMRVMAQTTKDAIENIDFAVNRNLQYILFDWKWYGPAFSFSSDATKVAIKDFDLPAIIKYGKERGVGVWLYVNQQALLTQSDSLFTVYKKWGVAGVKFGFVQSGSHRWTTWLEKTIRQAADDQIMVNIHDDWRPTGEQRTWPNLMTAEGIRGNEEMPDATNNTVMPFTRYLAGAADYTICYFDKRIKTTHAHQLSLAAIYFSPVQTLYWYDKPSFYNNEPELEFWDKIPTSWDETKFLQGEPGEFVSTARRKGTDWFLGTITNTNPRDLKLKFDFLPGGKTYTAKIYSDDDSMKTETKVGVKTIKINSSTVLDVNLKPSGGQAIWLKQN